MKYATVTACPDCRPCESCMEATRHALSPRELQILRMVTDSMETRHIGRELGISQETVKRHVTNLFNKTGTDNRTGLAMWAVKHGIVKI